jgi:hypothetical protein
MARKETSHLRLRVEATMLAKLEKSAEMNGRTLTGEITHRLDLSFHQQDLNDAINSLADRVVERIRDGR